MGYWTNKWILPFSVRSALGALIFFPVLLLSFFTIGLMEAFFANLQEQWVQEYLLFALLAFVFSYFLLIGPFRTWIFFYGIGLIFIGLSHIVLYLEIFTAISKPYASDYVHFTLYSLPVASLIISTVLIWRQQEIQTFTNSLRERVFAALGLLIALTLMVAEFFPWVKDTSKAVSQSWEFEGSGTNTLIKECCYVSDFEFELAMVIYLPLVGLAVLFLISSLGFRITAQAFMPSLIWCVQESLDFLTSLGVQDPLEIWTSQQIRESGLSRLREGLFGGYLFVGTSVCFAILLLIPRVINGQPSVNLGQGRVEEVS